MTALLSPVVSQYVSSSKCSPKTKATYLLTLVERVKKLDNVVVKSNVLIGEDGEKILIPGPLAIVEPTRSLSSFDSIEDDFDVESQSNTAPITYEAKKLRAPSVASPYNRSRSFSRDSTKFVVRNEFGHARIQQYLLHPYPNRDRTGSGDSSDKESLKSGKKVDEELFETGGHVVLHPNVFQACIDKGWGIRHPLAGHYHPITGTQIPETTLLFRAPICDADLEMIWSIVLSSYKWLTQDEEVSI